MKLTFFKTPKPRQFDYRPRYYDPEKEAREQRRKQLLGDDAQAPEGEYVPGQFIRNNMSARRGMTAQTRNRQKTVRPMRMIIMLVLLGIAVWWVLS